MNIEIYIKGGQEDKIAFLVVIVVGIIAFIIVKIKMWIEDRKK